MVCFLLSGKLRRRNTSNTRNRLAQAFRKSLFGLSPHVHLQHQQHFQQHLYQLHQLNPALANSLPLQSVLGSLPNGLPFPPFPPFGPPLPQHHHHQAGLLSAGSLINGSNGSAKPPTALSLSNHHSLSPSAMGLPLTNTEPSGISSANSPHPTSQPSLAPPTFAQSSTLSEIKHTSLNSHHTPLHSSLHTSLHLQPFLRSLSAAAVAAAAAVNTSYHRGVPVSGSPVPLCSPHSTGSSSTEAHSAVPPLGSSQTSAFGALLNANRSRSRNSSLSLMDDPAEDNDDERTCFDINVEDDDDDGEEPAMMMMDVDEAIKDKLRHCKPRSDHKNSTSTLSIGPRSTPLVDEDRLRSPIFSTSNSSTPTLSKAKSFLKPVSTVNAVNATISVAISAATSIATSISVAAAACSTQCTSSPPVALAASSANILSSQPSLSLPPPAAPNQTLPSLGSIPPLSQLHGLTNLSGFPHFSAGLTSLSSLPALSSALGQLHGQPFSLFPAPPVSASSAGQQILSTPLSSASLAAMSHSLSTGDNCSFGSLPSLAPPFSSWPFAFSNRAGFGLSNGLASSLNVPRILGQPEAK